MVCLGTVKMPTRKSTRGLKEVPVTKKIVPESKTEVKTPAEPCNMTAVIIEKCTTTKLDEVYGIHFKLSGNVVSTGSREEATLMLGQLPESVTADGAVAVKTFASMYELEAFQTSLKNKSESATNVRTASGLIPTINYNGKPQAEYDVKRSNLKRSEHPITLDLDDIPEVNVVDGNTAMKEATNNNDDQSADGVLASQSPAAKRMRTIIRTKGMKLIIHYWPNVPGSAVAQIVFIDIIDTRQDFTHWLQRPKKWVDVFGNIEQECANTPNPLGKFFTQMRCAHFRAPLGDNVSHTKIVKVNEGVLS